VKENFESWFRERIVPLKTNWEEKIDIIKNMEKENLGGWAISEEVFHWIIKNIKKNSTILELGSGSGTKELSKLYKVYSVEHNENFLNKYPSNYIYAPIKEKNGQLWYDTEVLKNEIPKSYDLILIDGPPGNIGRMPFLENLELFNLDVPIMVDDTNRKDERILFERLQEITGKKHIDIECGDKECKVLI
jgi:hypothetical protein